MHPSPSTEASQAVLEMPSGDSQWMVLHARPRCEKKVSSFCDTQGISCYLPLRKKVHHYGGRRRSFLSPLFPGYLFCVTTPNLKHLVRQNLYVANILDVCDQETLLHQLRQIQQALAVGDVVEVMPFIEEGKAVRVTGGSFKGLEGKIIRVKGQTRVVMNVDMIQQSIAIEVDAALLAPA